MKWIFAVLAVLLVQLPAISQHEADPADANEIETLTQDIARGPTVQSYAKRGLLYDKDGIPEKAEADFNQAIKLEPNNPDLLWRRGMARAEQEKFNEALVDCANTLKLSERGDSNYMQALRIRTHCFEELHREQEMIADMKELSALGDSTAAAAVQRWENDHKSGLKDKLEAMQIPLVVSQWDDVKAAPWPAIEKTAAAMNNDEPRLGPMHVRASVALILIREYPVEMKKYRDEPIKMVMQPDNGPEVIAAYLGYVKRCLESDKRPVFLKPVYWEQIQKLWKEGKTNDALALSYHPELGNEQIEGVRHYMDQIKNEK